MRSEVDHRGIRKLLYEPGISDQLLDHARAARDIAFRNAPHQTGAYRESLFAERGRFRYVLAYVGGEDRKSLWIERGSHDKHGGWRPRHTLAEAARRAGMRIVYVESRGVGPI
jgi:hypothetical protein